MGKENPPLVPSPHNLKQQIARKKAAQAVLESRRRKAAAHRKTQKSLGKIALQDKLADAVEYNRGRGRPKVNDPLTFWIPWFNEKVRPVYQKLWKYILKYREVASPLGIVRGWSGQRGNPTLMVKTWVSPEDMTEVPEILVNFDMDVVSLIETYATNPRAVWVNPLVDPSGAAKIAAHVKAIMVLADQFSNVVVSGIEPQQFWKNWASAKSLARMFYNQSMAFAPYDTAGEVNKLAQKLLSNRGKLRG